MDTEKEGIHIRYGPVIRDRFEYRIETLIKSTLIGQTYDNDAMMADLNKRGADGWELVSLMGMPVSQSQVAMQFVWKRKIVEPQQ